MIARSPQVSAAYISQVWLCHYTVTRVSCASLRMGGADECMYMYEVMLRDFGAKRTQTSVHHTGAVVGLSPRYHLCGKRHGEATFR